MKWTLRLALAVIAATGIIGAATALSQPEQRRAFLPMVVLPGDPAAGGEVYAGRATYYNATGDGNCLLGPSPNDLMVAAISHVNYSDPGPAAWCGAYVEVTGELGSVVVRIVDKCPDAGCLANHLDLSPQAFARIAPIAKGIVPITWRLVSPDLGRPVAYHLKDGSNQWWTAIQVRHHRNPIVKLEYRDGGRWVALERQDYNYFVGTNMGPGPYTLRITDSFGNVLQDSGIPLIPEVEHPGAAQFP